MACTCLAVALTGLHPYVPALVVVLLLANAAARLSMPAFPTDQSGNRFATVKGTIHMLLAVVAFGAVAAAATGLGGLFSHYSAWHSAKSLLVTLGWVVLAGAVACAVGLVGPRLKPVFAHPLQVRTERSLIGSASREAGYQWQAPRPVRKKGF